MEYLSPVETAENVVPPLSVSETWVNKQILFVNIRY